MVVEAIGALKERTGSSQYAIAKYLEDKYNTGLPPNFKKTLSTQLRNLSKAEKLVKVKNSFKLSNELKKTSKPVKAPSAPQAVVKVAPKAKAIKKLVARRVKTKSAGEGAAKSKAPSAKVIKGAEPQAKATKTGKMKSGSKAAAAAPKKAVAKTSVSAKKSTATAKKMIPSAVAKKPVTVRKPPTVRKMTTPKKVPKSVKGANAGVKAKAVKAVGTPAKKARK